MTGFFTEEKINAPSSRINEEDIDASDDKVVINVKNPILTRYADSESMAPLFGDGAIGIEIIPASKEDIHVGDVVTFRREGILIAHRVVEIGSDEDGGYFITKGDNNNAEEDKIRFEQIESVLVGVIY
ncbi:MAG: signal peptidase I [Ignavibacteria bacterium]|nr:signal peptidase I [Ignavibacteria bacterium]